MVNITNFIVSLKFSWIKKLILRHKLYINIFKAINGNDFQKRLIDSVDVFLVGMVQRNNIIGQDVFEFFFLFYEKNEPEVV